VRDDGATQTDRLLGGPRHRHVRPAAPDRAHALARLAQRPVFHRSPSFILAGEYSAPCRCHSLAAHATMMPANRRDWARSHPAAQPCRRAEYAVVAGRWREETPRAEARREA